MDEKPRKQFQFGLRDIAWAVLVVALSLGWWADRRTILHRAEAEAAAALQREEAYAEKEKEFARLRSHRLQRILKGE